MKAERGSCPVCDRLYAPGSSSGICTECATGEITHPFQGEDDTTCEFMIEEVGGLLRPCWANRTAHLS